MRKDKDDCCGCSACAARCPKKAIEMRPDDMGFLYPVIDEKKCIDCGLCEKVCNFYPNALDRHEVTVKEVFGGRLKYEELLAKSQSGGAFWSLATNVIKSHGVVYGVAFSSDFAAEHIRTTTLEALEKLRGSKYVQSRIGDVYREVKDDLESGREVLFSGTPCQVAGLYGYLGPVSSANNLFTVDLVCHGIPAPQVWKDYLSYIEKNNNKKIVRCIFRDKSYGWGSHVETFYFADGTKSSNYVFRDLFYSHLVIRESCHHCPYANLNRVSDITIGDYWGWQRVSPRFNDQKGVSLFLINTAKGEKLFKSAQRVLEYEKSHLEDCLQPQLKGPAFRPDNKDKFQKDYLNRGFGYVIRRYGFVGWRYNLKTAINAIILFNKKIKWHINHRLGL